MQIKALSGNPDGRITEVSQDMGEMMIRRGVAEAVPETAPSRPDATRRPPVRARKTNHDDE